MIEARIISIGALAAHPLWGERAPVRSGHATTTLIRSNDAVILVDPGLPGEIIASRLGERAGLDAKDITHVFLTSFKPDTWRGITRFDHAQWRIYEPERERVGAALVAGLARAREADDQELTELLARDIGVLKRCAPVADSLAPHVDLFPLPGVTLGLCGLLIAAPRETIVLCGDAIPTVEHLEAGKVLPNSADVEQAKESLLEAVEIADLLILGRDNIVSNPSRRLF